MPNNKGFSSLTAYVYEEKLRAEANAENRNYWYAYLPESSMKWDCGPPKSPPRAVSIPNTWRDLNICESVRQTWIPS